MSMFQCPVCGQVVLRNAMTCPGCGQPFRETPGQQLSGCLWFALAIPVIFVAVTLIDTSSGLAGIAAGVIILMIIAGMLNRQDPPPMNR